ncbi:AEC family transporter [Seohaeicola nanhaiensis]|uniref:AEC family transporter n=1 Tax=Seohaeicola nanhaiensis TaxID=1387282 RepID=A0ABV9KF58_9RHOB
MIDIFLRTLPFFAIIGLGYWAGYTRFFTAEATAYLTKFVFYFALSAMLFRFAANLDMAAVFNGRLIAGYLWGTAFVYGIATAVAFLRGLNVQVAAIEAQCAVIGNVGFLGLPMFVILFGEQSIGPMMLVLATDLIVFSSLIVILINGVRDGRMRPAVLKTVGLGLVRNPMIVAISAGMLWSAFAIPVPAVMNDFLTVLGGAATPGALFAIGASLAGKSAERIEVAGWLTFCKLVLHPLFVAVSVLVIFPLKPYEATIVVAAAAMPVAGNVFMLAQHYGVAAKRVSAAILFSTAISILTFPLVVSWVSPS